MESAQQLDKSNISDDTKEKILKLEKETLSLKTELENLTKKKTKAICIVSIPGGITISGLFCRMMAGNNSESKAIATIILIIGILALSVTVIIAAFMFIETSSIKYLRSEIQLNEERLKQLKRG